MQSLVFNNTQKLRTLQRLLNQESVNINELSDSRPHGEGIKQYGARIKDLRDFGYKIENFDCEFKLDRSNLPQILEKLRVEWSLSTGKQKDQVQAEGLMIKQSMDNQIIKPQRDVFVEDVAQYLGAL